MKSLLALFTHVRFTQVLSVLLPLSLTPFFPGLAATVTPPSAPTGLAAIPASTTKVSLAWSAASSGTLPISNYRVFRGPSATNLTQLTTVTKTSYTDPTATAGATFYYAVAAADTNGNVSPDSDAAIAVLPTPPAAPTGISATPTSATAASVTWNTAASGGLPVLYYQVFRGTSPASLSNIATVTQNSYTDRSLSSGGTYYYAVEAQDSGADLSGMSAVAAATAFWPPAAPVGLTGTPISTTMDGLTWNSSASGGLPVPYYLLFRGSSPSTLAQIAIVLQTSFTDQTVTAGQTYYYAVQAKDSGGDTSPLSTNVAVLTATNPSVPANLAATPTNGSIAGLSWSPSTGGGLPVTYYLVFRGLSPSSLSQIAMAGQNSYTDTSLSPGVTYYYAVQAKDSGGDASPLSGTAAVTTYTIPSAPAEVVAAAASDIPPGAPQPSYSVSLTWNPPGGGGLPVSFYQVLRGSSPLALNQIAALSQTSYTDSSVNAATTYYYAVVAGDTEGDLSAPSSPVVVTTAGGQASGSFNILPMTINSFTPSPSNLSGLPTVNGASGPLPSIGYQGGAVLNGKAIYIPWQVANGGTTWGDHVTDGIAQSVIMAYDTSAGIDGFGNASNWTVFDLSDLSWYSKGGIQGGNALPNLPAGFLGSSVAGNMVYLAPKGGGPGVNGGGGPYPVFVQYNSLQALDDPTAYQTFVPPPMGTTLGNTYGFCTAVFDGQFVYYAPLSNTVNGNSGNILRYDTTQPFSNLATGGATAAWQNFDMNQNARNPGGIDPNAEGFQTIVYDGYRYIYYIPFKQALLVRYDTWNGGTGPDPTGFTVASNYVTFDPTQLGGAGYPTVNGTGNTANLLGFTGATVVWDAAHRNEYLYLVPWATFPNDAKNPTLQSTVARVRIGVTYRTFWNPVDITSTATYPPWVAPNWEMYDLSQLTNNPAWPSEWPLLQSDSTFSGQSSIAGWQAAFPVTANSSGETFPPRVVFVPDVSDFLLEHDVAYSLSDPTGWYVSEIPNTYSFGTMGGGYDAASSILYPASPGAPLYAFQF